MESKGPTRVAVVGSGMAGLVSAYLLRCDTKKRYEVEVFEIGSVPSLDSASCSVKNLSNGNVDRIDLPMRAFTGGYYRNLIAMYDHLGVRYGVQQFLWVFSKPSLRKMRRVRRNEKSANDSGSTEKLINDGNKEESCSNYSVHFVHSSYSHQLPLIIPESMAVLAYIQEIVFVALCYFWYTVCCLFLSPRPETQSKAPETWGEYLDRIRLPKYFVNEYLVPMIASVATSPHETALQFPAHDVVQHKYLTTTKRHYTVLDGMDKVQAKLMKGLDIRFSAQVASVSPLGDGTIQVSWRKTQDAESPLEHKIFDRVILAVPANVVGSIFKKSESSMSLIPSVTIENVVHTDDSATREQTTNIQQQQLEASISTGRHLSRKAHIIFLHKRQLLDGKRTTETEVSHIYPGGTISTTCPISPIDQTKVIQTSKFTRVLRTTESRKVINEILGARKSVTDLKNSSWRNGDDGVWIVGGWCWDGMVLLEGCIVSSMRVARAFDVEIPW